MASVIVSVEPFDLVVFGGTGDLAYRKLYPSLYQRDRDRQFTEPTRVISASRAEISTAEMRQQAEEALRRYLPAEQLDPVALARFLGRLTHVSLDASGDRGWSTLAGLLPADAPGVRMCYLATSPDRFGDIAQRLGAHDLVRADARVVLEKPLGKDLASAAAINAQVATVFAEQQVYRIDHYLGKETVQNLMVLRFANALFEPLWNAANIDHVQITVAETIGVGQRGDYYDGAGALRDMVQNHLLQMLCLVAMEPPASLAPDAVRDEKLKVLKALRPIDRDNLAQTAVFGQYRAGACDGVAVPGYLEDVARDASRTETFVALKTEIANWRWAGVPFYLRSGKRMESRLSEIVVSFRPARHSIFDAAAGPLSGNRLVMRLQPDEAVTLWVTIKDPGPGGMRLRHVPLDMSFAKTFDTHFPDAYERLLMDVVRGNQTLFMRRDEVEAAWRWIDPIVAAWGEAAEPPRPYPAGSWGPAASVALVERDRRTWHEELS
jgi:glucose-6-phosphate 1-dehydrogenase